MTSSACLLTDTQPAPSSLKADGMEKLVAGGDATLAGVSDCELLAKTRRLVGTSNQLFAALLIHLAEVETRGLHRTRACSSLYTYCIYELRFSEDAAARRVSAARLVKRFPPLALAVAEGALHLTGLLMLGPHLTPENHATVLMRARFRTKKELVKLVRELSPLPSTPDSIEPLGPEPAAPRNPSWQDFTSSLAPLERDLPVGERPGDWANDAGAGGASGASVVANVEAGSSSAGAGSASCELRECGDGAERAAARTPASEQHLPPPLQHTAGRMAPPIAGPQFYQMQFCTSEEHVHLVERAEALLAHSSPGVSLGDLHLRAMRLLVAALEKAKFGVPSNPKLAASRHGTERLEPPRQRGVAHADGAERLEPPRQRGVADGNEQVEPPRQRGVADGTEQIEPPRQRGVADGTEQIEPPRQRGVAYGTEQIEPPRQRGAAYGTEQIEPPRQRGTAHGSEQIEPPRQRGDARGNEKSEPPRQRGDVDGNEPVEPPRQRGDAHGSEQVEPPRQRGDAHGSQQVEPPRQRGDARGNERSEPPRQRGVADGSEPVEPPRQRGAAHGAEPVEPPRQRGRYVPVAVRYAVFERDGARCGYVDVRGDRCRETQRLEFHHREPFARNGQQTEANLTLYCSAHNALMADLDFGSEHMQRSRDRALHESFASEQHSTTLGRRF